MADTTKPPVNLTSLRARLRNHARDVSQVENRVQRRLAALVLNEIFLSADLGVEGPPILIKGGTAIDLRRGLAPSRLSKDLDAVVRGDMDQFLVQARSLLETGWAGFTGRVVNEGVIEVPGLAIKPRRFEAKLEYLGKPFITVPVELSPVEGGSASEYDLVEVTEYDSIGLGPSGPVRCLSLRYQIAQKIHACTDPYDGTRENDRARDLVDLQLLTLAISDDHLPTIREACVEIFDGRGRHAWPPEVRIWPSWPVIYRASSETLGDDVVSDVEAAAQWLEELIKTVDDAGAQPAESVPAVSVTED